jgi:hypothetical protein
MATITREEFLHEYVPEYKSWASQASAADIKTPTDARIVSGWVVEQPLHTYFNWHMNRTDDRLTQLEARVAWLEKCLASQIASTTR